MAALSLVAIPSALVALVIALVGMRSRHRLARPVLPAPEEAAHLEGAAEPVTTGPDGTGTTETGQDETGQDETVHELRVLRLLVRSMEELVAEQAVEIAELQSRSDPGAGAPVPPGGSADAPGAARPTDDAAVVVRSALSGLAGPDADARVAAALAVLETPRTFTRPVVASVSPEPGHDEQTTSLPATQGRLPAEDVPTVESLPQVPPAPAGPEIVLPVPAPSAPVVPARRRLFRSRAA
jgi:hypothetical protein